MFPIDLQLLQVFHSCFIICADSYATSKHHNIFISWMAFISKIANKLRLAVSGVNSKQYPDIKACMELLHNFQLPTFKFS